MLNTIDINYLFTLKEQYLSKQGILSAGSEHYQARMEPSPHCIEIPSDGADVWEIDTNQLKYENKVGSGSFGDLWVISVWNILELYIAS